MTFGSRPHSGSTSAVGGISSSDYRFGGGPGGAPRSPRREVSIWRAPWTLLISALLFLGSATFLVYFLTDRWIDDPASRGFDMTFGAAALGAVTAVVFVVLTLRSYHFARVVLTVWAAVSLLTLAHQVLWPVALAAAAGAVLLWLPASSRWINY